MLATALEISRSEAMTGREQFTWFDVGALTDELCEMYEPVAEEAGAGLEIERPAGSLPLFGHRQLIAQAVSNLIENAIRYGARGGDIRVLSHKDGKQLAIAVADRGPGIPPERRTEALRRFGRLDFEPGRGRRRTWPGTGPLDRPFARRRPRARGQCAWADRSAAAAADRRASPPTGCSGALK